MTLNYVKQKTGIDEIVPKFNAWEGFTAVFTFDIVISYVQLEFD